MVAGFDRLRGPDEAGRNVRIGIDRQVQFAGRIVLVLAIAAAIYRGHPVGASEVAPMKRMNMQVLKQAADTVRPLHHELGVPGPSDWLANHDEPGQTFQAYVASGPVTPTDARRTIVILPLGAFSGNQRRILDLTCDFMKRFYGVPVRVQSPRPLSAIPAHARRRHPAWGVRQLLTRYVLDEILKPRMPGDAIAHLALTACDLWPGKGWNFVFGQASLRHRVGVWSIHRNGDPDAGDDGFRLCLMRTVKTAVHEVGHMLSMRHCIAYECCMNGSNHRQEADRRPLWLCPECMAKVCWATRTPPAPRYRRLADFCAEHGLQREENVFRASRRMLKSGE